MKSSTKLYVFLFPSIFLAVVIMLYIIATPLYIEYNIKKNFSEKEIGFKNVLTFYKSLYPIFVYFHSKDKIDLLIWTKSHSYFEVYDKAIDDEKVDNILHKVDISRNQIQNLYVLLDKINCNSIGMSPYMYKDRNVIEISYCRSFWFYSWNYLFFQKSVSEKYIRMNSFYGENYYSINDTVGWGNVK